MRVLKRHEFCLSLSLSILATACALPLGVAAQNASASQDDVKAIAQATEKSERGERVGRLSMPQLRSAALPSPALRVRVAVAQNTRTPREILTKLSKDESLMVRQAVAQNPSTPPEVIDQLAQTSDEMIFEALLRNSRMPETVTLTK